MLRRRFGHRFLRPVQRPIVEAMLRGEDLLAVIPTGAGKSLCFQLPAAMEPGLTLVVSPLIALMDDQVTALRRIGVAAAALTSATPAHERREILRRAGTRRLRLLYVSPERLGSPSFRTLAETLEVRRLVVDEAHCISEWGHDFRPAYLGIREFARSIGAPPVAAFTATATPRTREEIERRLDLRKPRRFLRPVGRPNLYWEARSPPDLRRALLEMHAAIRTVLRGDRRSCALVYVSTRGRAVRVAEALGRLGLPAASYHAGLPDDMRAARQRAFLNGPLRVLCATSAFGMGIDHRHLRLVGHIGLPGSLEAYVQEAGRAGRDGAAARCVLLSLPGDAELHRRRITSAWPSWRRIARVWRAVTDDRAVSPEEVESTLGPRLADAVPGALRLLEEFGAVRALAARGGKDAGGVGSRSDLRFVRARVPPPALLLRARAGRRRAFARFRHMQAYASGRTCLGLFVSRYFGERPERCGRCDRCQARVRGGGGPPG